ncbi:MAG: hypothetical protein ACRDOK_22160 [Streptosporangiaceae bacterium]
MTYLAAPPLSFTNEGVNVDLNSSGNVTQFDAVANDIYLGVVTSPGNPPTVQGDGLTEGQAVIYEADTSGLIGGLTPGTTYYVVLTAWTIQLAATYCDAVGACKDSNGNTILRQIMTSARPRRATRATTRPCCRRCPRPAPNRRQFARRRWPSYRTATPTLSTTRAVGTSGCSRSAVAAI